MKREKYIHAGGFRTLLALMVFAAQVAFLPSCSKDEPNDDPWQVLSATAVDFNIQTTSTTQTKLTDKGFEGGDKLGIFGYLVNDNNVTGLDDEGQVYYDKPYIEDWKLIYNTSNSTQVYDSPYYWPKFNHCDYESIWFYAYYIYPRQNTNVGPALVTPTNAKPYFTYKTDVEGDASVEDFLVAQTNADKNNVPLKFKHPLAKVEWYIKNLDFIGTNGVDITFPINITGRYDFKSKLDNNVVEEVGDNWSNVATSEYITLDNSVFVPGITEEDYNKIFQSSGSADYSSVSAVKVDECYLIPQDLQGVSIVYNYHTEPDQTNVQSGEVKLNEFDLDLKAGCIHKITLIINRHHVIRVGAVTIDGSNKATVNEQWWTISNENTI